MLCLKGPNTSDVITTALKDMYILKKPVRKAPSVSQSVAPSVVPSAACMRHAKITNNALAGLHRHRYSAVTGTYLQEAKMFTNYTLVTLL
jgi:hypothetical protein